MEVFFRSSDPTSDLRNEEGRRQGDKVEAASPHFIATYFSGFLHIFSFLLFVIGTAPSGRKPTERRFARAVVVSYVHTYVVYYRAAAVAAGEAGGGGPETEG